MESDYAISSQLYLHDMSVCMFMFSPFCLFCLQAPAPQEGGAKAEVFSSIPPLLPSLFLVSFFILINQDLTLHYDFFSPESEIRARLQSASPTACRCKTAWDALIQLLCHEATKHLYLTVYSEKKEIFYYCWAVCFLNHVAQDSVCHTGHSPSPKSRVKGYLQEISISNTCAAPPHRGYTAAKEKARALKVQDCGFVCIVLM